MDLSNELQEKCSLLSDSLRELHQNLSSGVSKNDSRILHETCHRTKDMVQKDLVILGAQSNSFTHISQRILSSLLPKDSSLKVSVFCLDRVVRDINSIELMAHSSAYIVVLNKELLSWLTSQPGLIIGRLIRSPNKTIGIFIGDGKYLNKGHRDQLVHFHRWNRVVNADLECPRNTDRLIKTTLERILAYSNASGSSFRVISPEEFVGWKRNRLLILIQGQELDINSRVELEIDKGSDSIQAFSRLSSQVIEFNLPPISSHTTSIELIVDGSSLGRASIRLRDPSVELSLLQSIPENDRGSLAVPTRRSGGYISLKEAVGAPSSPWQNQYYAVPRSNSINNDYDTPPSRLAFISNSLDQYKF